MTTKSPAAHPIFQLIPALWIFWAFGIQTVGQRLWIEANGIIMQSQALPSAGAPRYVTYYTIQDQGLAPTTYVAGPTDASLPRDLPNGTEIHKHRWHLSYVKNGVTVDDFPIGFYSGMMGLATGFALWGGLRWRTMHKNESQAPYVESREKSDTSRE